MSLLNSPDPAGCQLAGDRGSDDIGQLAVAGELAIARAEPQLRLPGDLADWPGRRSLARATFPSEPQLVADPGREAQQPDHRDTVRCWYDRATNNRSGHVDPIGGAPAQRA